MVGLLVLVLAGCGDEGGKVSTGAGTVSRYTAGERPAAPDVAGELVQGGRFSLAEARGDVVVMNFWGSWCAPCRAEADDLQAVYAATRAAGVRFVGVNVSDTVPKAKAFDRAFGITYPSLSDPAGRVALRFRQTPPSAVPATIVIDRRGGVAAVFRTPLIEEDLRPIVDRLAAEPR